MVDKKTIKELKKEIKEIEKRIAGLGVEKKTVENKGCFSDHELDVREKKINAIVKEIQFLGEEKKLITQHMISIEREKWLKKRGNNN